MKNEKIALLVEKVQQNKKKNFEKLFSATWDTVYYLSLNMMRNEHDAEDVSQDVFIKIHDSIDKLDESQAFNQWMNRIVMNTCHNALQKKSKSKDDVELDGTEDGDDLNDFLEEDNTEFLPAALADKKETRDIIAKLVSELPEKQKEAVLLYYYEDMNTAEIAELLNCGLSAVNNRLHHAKLSLRSKIEDYEKASGIKLHSIAVFPVLGMLLKAHATGVCTTGIQVQIWAGASAGIGAAGTTAGGTALAAFTKTVTAKVIAVALAGAIVTGGALMVVNNKPTVPGTMAEQQDNLNDTTVPSEKPGNSASPTDTEQPTQSSSQNSQQPTQSNSPTVSTVSGVSVTSNLKSMVQGSSTQFEIIVEGNNNPSWKVEWSVSGAKSSGTKIDDSGLLTVAKSETAEKLTVTATSAVDNTKSGKAEIYIWKDNGDGTATGHETVIIGNGTPGDSTNNQILNPAGTVLKTVKSGNIKSDGGRHYVDLGNGFKLYPGADGKLGTRDDIVKGFGSYAQSDASGSTKDSLNWRLLDIRNGKAVLISDTVLDSVKYSTTTGSTTWANSNLRSWLNETFYNSAFTASEKNKIAETNVSMSSETFRAEWENENTSQQEFTNLKTSAQVGTSDKVWALSGTEVWRYFGSTSMNGYNKTNYTGAYAKGNAFAKSKGTMHHTQNSTAQYWLRSSGQDMTCASFVSIYGSVNASLGILSVGIGARPVITVKLS